MPIYDYLCTHCDHRADILHGINDPGPNFCPSCGTEGTMRKQFAAPAIHYKGSGWAKKDRGGASATKASRAANDTSDTKSDTSSDSAPDPKPASKGEPKASGGTTSSGGSSAAGAD